MLASRLVGLGSVFGKTIRDSRRSLLIAIVFLVLMILVGAAAIASAFGTEETRQQMVALATTLPAVFQGELGRPLGLDNLGGLIEWRYHSIVLLLMPVWSILALSGTLATEAGRGSLDLLLTAASTRRRVALEKVLAHVVVVLVAMLGLTLILWLSGLAFATLPRDSIAISDAASYALLAGLLMLLPGAIAFAASSVIGRGAAAGLAAVFLFSAYFINGFRSAIPAFENATPISWYAWTYDHVPLAQHYDYGSLGLVALVTLALFVVGVLAFERRDVGITVRVPAPHLPTILVGLRGPFGRTLSERTTSIVAWGIGIGVYVLLIATSASQLASMMSSVPSLDTVMRTLYPDIDLTTVGGFLQLIFIGFGLVVFGFTAATVVGGWASEETSGRLEVLLATPMSRASWVVRSGLGVMVALVLIAALVALASAVGAISQGSDPVTPALGSFVLALYGCALAGVGIAVGGVVRSSLAVPTVIVLTVGMFLIGLLALALNLPDWVAQLNLADHYGKPLVGDWDLVGVMASIALAVGGIAVGAWGLQRRDLRG